METRKKHLQWCKDRSLKYLDEGNPTESLSSFISDMSKHKETENHPMLFGISMFKPPYHSHIIKNFIEGFN